MAAEKKLNTRIIQKHDSSLNWEKAINFKPLKGEIVVYEDLNKIKIGDGIHYIKELPFVEEQRQVTGSYDEETGFLTLSLMFGGYNEDSKMLILGLT